MRARHKRRLQRRTDRVHRVRRKFEHTIKDEVAALEKDVTPVPTIILDDAVRFGFHPEIKHDECHTTDPTKKGVRTFKHVTNERLPHDVNSKRKPFRDTKARKRKHAIRQKVTAQRHPQPNAQNAQTHLSKITSTSCLNNSHVLYSSGSS